MQYGNSTAKRKFSRFKGSIQAYKVIQERTRSHYHRKDNPSAQHK